MLTKNKIFLAAAAGVLFIAIAIGGSVFTSRQMNKAADEHGASSGRPGDPKPNALQEFQHDPSARGSPAQRQGSTVPPAR